MSNSTRSTPRLEALEAREVPAAPTFRLFATGAGEGGGPQVNVYNDTGQLVRSFFAYDPNFRGGVRVATGDVTGDGWDDVVTGAGPGGGPHVKVFDGISGAEVRSFFAFNPGSTAGVKVAVGNVNAAGTGDVIASGVEFGTSRIKVFENGQQGALYYIIDQPNVGVYNVASSDFDGDGFKDVVLGTPNAAATGIDVQIRSYRRALLGLDPQYVAFGLNAVGQVSVAGGNLNGIGADELGFGYSTGGTSVVGVRGDLNYDLFNPIGGWGGEVRVAFGDFRTPVLGGALVIGVGPGGGPVMQVRDAFNPGWVFMNQFVYDPNFRGGIYVG